MKKKVIDVLKVIAQSVMIMLVTIAVFFALDFILQIFKSFGRDAQILIVALIFAAAAIVISIITQLTSK